MPPHDWSVPGARLLRFHHRWTTAPSSTCKTLKRGFHWEWNQTPPPLATPVLDQGDPDLAPLIRELQRKNAVYEVTPQPCFISRIFKIPKASGENRLIIDWSKLNSFIKTEHYKMTNHLTLVKLISTPAWAVKIDLQDAYLHIPMRDNLHKYLAFVHNKKLFFFKALPFGLSVAPALFTSVLKHPLGLLHQLGISVIAFLDDWIIWDHSPNQTSVAARTTVVINKTRIHYQPREVMSSSIPKDNMVGCRMVPQRGKMGRDATKRRPTHSKKPNKFFIEEKSPGDSGSHFWAN